MKSTTTSDVLGSGEGSSVQEETGGHFIPDPLSHPRPGSPHEFKSTLTVWTEPHNVNGG